MTVTKGKRTKPTEGQKTLRSFLVQRFGSLDKAARASGLSYGTIRSLVQDGKPRRLDYSTVESVLALGAKREWLPLL